MKLNDITRQNDLHQTLIENGCILQEPAIYYHLSRKNLGPAFTLSPQIPELANEDEPPWPRICLATTVGGTVMGSGIWLEPPRKGAFLYQTKPIRAYSVPDELCADAGEIGEYWSIEPTPIEFLRHVPYKEIIKLELEWGS